MLSLAQINKLMLNLKDWSLEDNCIVKEVVFENFKQSIEFVIKIGELAEKHNHHPDILINYDKVRLTLTTRAEKSLSEKDFKLAEEIDKIQ